MKMVSDSSADVLSVPGSKLLAGDRSGSESANRRLAREWQTIVAMVECYCRGVHATKTGLCPECQGLIAYANKRLDRCQFGPAKPTCARCPVHCYQADRREQIRAVMRYAGPRMLWLHPILSLHHWLDSFRKQPPVRSNAGRGPVSGHAR